MKEEQPYYDNLKTDWNQAIPYHMRINNCLQECNFYSSLDNYDCWYKWIDNLRRELYGRMNELEKIESKRLLEKARGILTSNRILIDKYIKRNMLSEAEEYLRIILRLRGMDLPSKADPHNVIMNDKGF